MREQDASDAAPDGNGEGESGPDADVTDDEAADGTATEEATGTDAAAGEDASSGQPASDTDAVDEELVERVAGSDPESIAREIAELRVEVEGLEGKLADREETIDDLESKLARARADFQNYKKRAENRREEEAERAKADLVDRLLGVHDNLERALEQDEDVDIRDGVESTLRQFDDVLAAEGVEPIDPAPGDEVDPHRHQVLVRVESDRPEGTVDEVHRVGYEMGETIVREAQVTVSDGSGDGGDDGDGDDGGAASDGSDADDREREGGSDE